MLTHYDRLGIGPTANTPAIRSAHADMVARLDRQPPGPEVDRKRRDLDTALAVLTDPATRARYDAEMQAKLAAPLRPTARTVPAAPTLAASVAGGAESAVWRPQHPALAPMGEPAPEMAPHPALARMGDPVAEPQRLAPDPRTFEDGRDRRAAMAQEAFDREDWSGFWRRVAASIIDGFVMMVPAWIVILLGTLLLSRSGVAVAVVPLLAYAACIGYLAWFITTPHVATLGRRAVGIAVVHGETGEPISGGRALGRTIVSFLGNGFLLPVLVMLFNRRRRTLSDLLGGTVVVRYDPTRGGVAIVIGLLAVGVVVVGILAAIAIPSYQDYVHRSKLVAVRADLGSYSRALEAHVREQRALPASLADLNVRPSQDARVHFTLTDRGVLQADLTGTLGYPAQMALEPVRTAEGGLSWRCVTTGLRKSAKAPADCTAE